MTPRQDRSVQQLNNKYMMSRKYGPAGIGNAQLICTHIEQKSLGHEDHL